MATYSHEIQSSVEELVYVLDYSPQLLSGDSVSSCAVTHTPPSGDAVSVTASVVSGYVYVPIPSGLVVGIHKFSCIATTTNANNSPEIMLVITVDR